VEEVVVKSVDLVKVSVTLGGQSILRDVSLSVPAGQWCTIVGPNGAGKTTVLNALSGTLRPQAGTVTFAGSPIAELREKDRAKLVSVVTQHPVIPVGMTVFDFVLLGRVAFHGVLRAPSKSDANLVTSVIERLGLSSFATREVATLSGGERQRCVLARALAQSTPVLLLDEPTTGLDVRHQLEFLEVVRREVDECGLTVVATLHDLTLAGQFADRLVLLDRGAVVLDDTAHAVVRSEALGQHYGVALRVVEVDGRDVVVPLRTFDDGK
jgi:iron complex transport system ATP-binding protein